MFGRLLGMAILGAMLLGGASALQAQTISPGVAPTLDSCRDEATRRGIRGDGLSGFLNECMSQPAATGSGDRALLDRCRSDAVSRNLSGEARGNHIDDCMRQSGETGAPATTGTYRFCREQARGRGLSGNELDQFLNSCIVATR